MTVFLNHDLRKMREVEEIHFGAKFVAQVTKYQKSFNTGSSTFIIRFV